MTKFLDLAGLTALWNKIKNTFVRWADTSTATTISIDSTPTSNSTNLITSGGVYGSIPKDYEIDYSKRYLTIVSLEDNNTIGWKVVTSAILKTISVSIDKGKTWIEKTSSTAGTTLATLNSSDELLIKGSNTTYSDNSFYNYFTSTNNFNVEGNIMSLIYGDNFIGQTTLDSVGYNFKCLFYNCKLISAGNLILPATILTNYCYDSMFSNCTSLIKAPELPATILATGCYGPMFSGCASLITAPELPATTLADWCYRSMFSNCTSLTKAPELPATTLTNHCYAYMFNGCTSLNYIKCLAINISASECTETWVLGVSSGIFIKSNESMTSWTAGNNGIPSGWQVFSDYATTNKATLISGSGDDTTYPTTRAVYNAILNSKVEQVSHTFVKNVTTSAGEKGEPQLRMWIDDYGYRSEIANEYGYSDWDSFLDGYVFGSHEDDDYAGANPFTYYGQTITLNGETYYLWEYDYLDEHESNFAYLITDTVDYDGLNAMSLASNYHNSTCPYVAVLDSDMEIYRTPSNDENDDVLVMITEL